MSDVIQMNPIAAQIRLSQAGPVLFKVLAARRAKHEVNLIRTTDFDTFTRIRAQLAELDAVIKLIAREE